MLTFTICQMCLDRGLNGASALERNEVIERLERIYPNL